MSGFPINLDLTEYFDDLRKFSSVYVNLSKCKDVGDVENHIKSVFSLEDSICLVNKKFLIPKSEDIQILQQYDIFKVQKCNFFDIQIHKTKKVNSSLTCDQNALNLTQSEKTIDLSCRPKQRLKSNICQSPGLPQTLTLHLDRIDSQMVSSQHRIMVNGNRNSPKEKQKHRKKKQMLNNESDDEAGTDENILDMSVNNSKRRKHSNCFSTDDGPLLSENGSDSNHKNINKDHYKKSKKRKKHSEMADDLASTCWESLVSDEIGIKDQSCKKKSKRSREDCLNGHLNTDPNKAECKSEVENPVDLDNFHDDERTIIRKKHKHNRKHGGSTCLHDSEENQYNSSSPLNVSKNHTVKKSALPKNYCDDVKSEIKSDKRKPLEEHKAVVKLKIDQMINDIHETNSDTNSKSNEDGEQSVDASINQSRSDNNLLDQEECCPTEKIKKESCSEFDFPNPKRKRKRKHNKKKKRERLMYMLAVGPALDQLVGQPPTARPSSSAETAKHVFFTEDSGEDGKILADNITNTKIEDSSKPLSSNAEMDLSQEQSSSSNQPVSWQEQVLKLSSNSLKPVVFHRSTPVAATDKQNNQEHSEPACNLNQNTQEHSKPAYNLSQNSCNSSDQFKTETENLDKCNSEVKSESVKKEDQHSCTGTVNGCSPRKGLADNCKPLPIPNDLQNINLTDYPIIDKVITEDLILFKVLKLNESNEPGVSKPILARVNGTSNFPYIISLQIMEGCEECTQYTQAEGSPDEPVTIELRWTDILEPRLFYP